jgi:hypothetical protein
MHTTHELIDLAKQRLALAHGLSLPMSDYRFQQLTGLKQTTVSAWRTGRSRIGIEFAAQFSEWTALPGAYVLACIEHERQKDPEVRSILEQIAEAFRGKAAIWIGAAIMATGMSLDPSWNQSLAASSSRADVYIMRSTINASTGCLSNFDVYISGVDA